MHFFIPYRLQKNGKREAFTQILVARKTGPIEIGKRVASRQACSDDPVDVLCTYSSQQVIKTMGLGYV